MSAPDITPGETVNRDRVENMENDELFGHTYVLAEIADLLNAPADEDEPNDIWDAIVSLVENDGWQIR